MDTKQDTLNVATDSFQSKSQEVRETIDMLSQKLGVSGNELWEVLVRQQVYEIISDLFISVVMSLILFGMYKLWNNFEWVHKPHGNGARIVTGALMIVYAVTTLIILLVNLSNIPALANPEFYALEHIMHLTD